ncbi:unnamed protein product [Didymodactylos carnosus]|uniref:Uncharacterized protein n=1 Tax=Didymodactylos carnosus TaxID=1234261 RepID=A0A8S2F8P3_9BILA|nr:unnamed protein product [Didymodactylos carnosus]CAF4200601.1 unnamed protein product [Didymodactylos carnosus]
MMTTDKFKPSYLKVPDRIFKQMLANSVENGSSQISQCLNTNEKLHFIRRIAEITNLLYFKGLQQQLWQEYDTISSKDTGDDNQWQSKTTKQYANQHNTCRTHKPKQSSIQ